jgi:hypothetical protein
MLINQIPTIEQPITDLKTVSILAIEALDALISHLIREGDASVSPRFLDWVSDSLTTTILARVEAAQQTKRFQESLRLGNPRIAIAYWIKHWTCAEIKVHFPKYAPRCPCAINDTKLVEISSDFFDNF